jgi:hypothetical protein
MGHGDGPIPTYASEGSEPALLYSSLFCEHVHCIFPSQQANAYARDFFESHKKLDESES